MLRSSSLVVILGLVGCKPDSGLNINNAVPTAEIVSHSDGDGVAEGYEVLFRGTGYDPDDGPSDLSATWWLGGEEICAKSTLLETGFSECLFLMPSVEELGASTLALDLEIEDSFGAVDVYSVTLEVVASDAPEVDILTPLDGTVAYSDVALELSATAADDIDNSELLVATWESSLDGELGSQSVGADGTISTSVNLSAGAHTLTLWVEDTLGKLGSDQVTVEVFGTNTDPSCEITAPVDGSAGEPDGAVSFEAEVTDAEESAEDLSVSWSSDLDGALGSGSPDSSGEISDSLEGLSEGTHVLSLLATDSAGGSCETSVRYTVGAAPIITLNEPSDGERFNEGEDVTFEATVLDNADSPLDLTIVWESNWDGVLDTFGADGSGSTTFTTSLLTVAEHEITLTATDTDGFSSQEIFTVIINDLPNAPGISLSPDPVTTTDDLVVTVDTASSDTEADPITYSYVWTVDGVTSSASSSATLPASAFSRDELVAVVVTPNDGYGDGDSAGASITVDNTPPAVGSVDLSPDPAVEGDTLSCTPVGGADDDGDSISYAYSWTVDGRSLSATSSTLADNHWDKGEDVICTVTPSDGTDAGAAVASNTVTIDNTAPSISTVTVSPSAPEVTDTLTCAYSGYADNDGDSDQSTYAWTVNGAAAGSSSSLASGSFSAGDTVTCTVTPYDGEDTGTAVADSVTVDNSLPSITSVSISPTSPTVSDTLTCSYSGFSDDDGDADQSTYAWTIGGSTVGTSSTLSSGYSKGDTVTCTVTPYDGKDTGAALASSVTVDNEAPVLASVSLTPTTATEGDTLSCTPGTVTDADGDTSFTYTYAWTVAGSSVGVASSSLSDSYWDKGEAVICTVTPNDGTDAGSPVPSNTVTISNAAPSVASVSISPSAPSVSDTLTCSYSGYSDPDGDADQSISAWTVNGSAAGSGSTLASGSFAAGDTVVCTVTPYDGSDTGSTASASVSVGNTPPTISSVSISPSSAQVGDTLTCSYSGYYDDDGDADQSTYAWTVNGTSAGSSSTLSTGFSGGDAVVCSVTPYDGYSTGSALSDSITVDNTAPVLADASLSPDPAAEGDTLTCTPGSVTDADGDSVSYTYAWTVDGSSTGTSSSTLADSYWAKSEAVICLVTPTDGTDAGSAVASNTVIIENSVPSITGVTVTPTDPTVSDTLTCAWTGFSDADNDTDSSTVSWTVGGSVVGTSTTLSGVFSAGDTVSCTVTPYDGEDTGTATSDTVAVDNSAPELASVSLSPTDATEGDLLSCTPGTATDADGDSISYTYSWRVAGVLVSASTSTLGDTWWDKGEAVICTVTPNDGSDDGDSVDSNTVTISNALPEIASVSVSPASPTVSDTLTCAYSGFSDADGDADSSTYSWTISGTEVGTSSTLSSGFSAGDTVTCSVTPNDGSDDGAALSDSVDVENTAPELTSVAISPSSPKVSDTLTCSASASDDDGDTVTLAYSWTIGGSVVGTSSTLSSSFSAGDTVTCTVTPNDGTEDGTSDSDAVTIDNSAPVLSSVSLTPTTAYEGDTFTCTPSATDADGDSISYSYEWYVAGTQVASSNSTLGDTFWDKDEAVYCRVTPTDGTDAGSAASSNSVTVSNSLPSISSVSVSPSSPSASDTLTCSYSGFSDADGDSDQSTYSWTISGTVVGTSSTLSSGFSAGDTVSCTVTPDDGDGTGTALSDSVTVTNSAPSISSVSISPSAPGSSDTLTCAYSGFSDPDGDSDQSTYAWTISGSVVGTNSTLSSSSTGVGDTVTCTVTPYDGTDAGTALADSVTITNTAPVMASVSLTPTSATEGDTLSCAPSATDADGDSISYAYAWTVNSVGVAATSSTLGDTYWDRGEDVVCTVTPSDGTDSGTSMASNTVTIGNSAPSISSVSISPSTAKAGDTLTCAYSGYSDADGDSDQSTYSWLIAGTVVGTSSTLSSGFSAGDTVVCEVTPDDGTDAGTAVSDSISITNTAPVMVSVSVTPNTPTVADTLICTPSATDADGDSISYAYVWSISGSTVGTSSTLSSGFTKGDTVKCTVTPNDGTDSGSSDFDTELIENSLPTLSSLSITPSAPKYASTMTASYSTSDADGDSVSVSYAWYVNGSQVATSSSLSVSAYAVKGNTIYLVATPNDGSASGSSATSATRTVRNTAPSAPAIDATDDPELGIDDIVCVITGASTDVDTADTVSYVFAWDADGSVYPDDFGSATGPDTTTYTDDTVPAADTSLATDWTCTAYATDGSGSSAEVDDTSTVVSASASLDSTLSGYTYASTGSYTSNGANYAFAQAYTFSSGATVTGFGVNWAFGYCTSCDMGIYNSSGGPTTVVGDFSSTSCGTSSGGSNEISGTPFAVSAGSYYIGSAFGSCSYGSTIYLSDSGGSGVTTYYKAHTAGSGLPDPFGATTNVSSKKYGIYPIGY